MKKSMLLLATFTMALLVLSLNREIQTSASEEVDITVLIQTAKTPEDHLKIAEYYEEQAVMMEKKANLHESMAEAYQGGKMAGMPTHCDKLAKESKESAEQYRAMAEEHKKMAQEMQSQNSKQPQ
jgi:predicted ATP-grasp superfamily ATP-dependent carboligase